MTNDILVKNKEGNILIRLYLYAPVAISMAVAIADGNAAIAMPITFICVGILLAVWSTLTNILLTSAENIDLLTHDSKTYILSVIDGVYSDIKFVRSNWIAFFASVATVAYASSEVYSVEDYPIISLGILFIGTVCATWTAMTRSNKDKLEDGQY